MVAVPGYEHDVVCYERLNWKPLLTLRGEHMARVNLVAFAPDGAALRSRLQPPASLARTRLAAIAMLHCAMQGCRMSVRLVSRHQRRCVHALAEVHVATAGCDKKVAIWNVVTQRCIATRDSGAAVVSDLAWQVCSLHLRRPENDAHYQVFVV